MIGRCLDCTRWIWPWGQKVGLYRPRLVSCVACTEARSARLWHLADLLDEARLEAEERALQRGGLVP